MVENQAQDMSLPRGLSQHQGPFLDMPVTLTMCPEA